MERHPATTLLSLATILLLAPSAPAHAKKPLQDVPLVWRPTSQIGSAAPVVEAPDDATVATASVVTTGGLDTGGPRGASGRVRIQVEAFVDTRKDPKRIGENREDEAEVVAVTTRDDVAAWCTQRVRELLDQLGFDVVEGDGDVFLTGQVRRFLVSETNTYEGDVGLKIGVRSRTGQLLWSGLANGQATRFGRSYKLENYYEVISDSLLDAVQKLADHPAFVGALGRPPLCLDGNDRCGP